MSYFRCFGLTAVPLSRYSVTVNLRAPTLARECELMPLLQFRPGGTKQMPFLSGSLIYGLAVVAPGGGHRLKESSHMHTRLSMALFWDGFA